jgi:uncharacterized LabA/DUF88 family protein
MFVLLEPEHKRALVFVDGQNLYHAAREAFGYRLPNYDVTALARWVCREHDWALAGVRFYTSLPDGRAPFWRELWSRKLGAMGHAGVTVVTRPLRYRVRRVRLADGSMGSSDVADEKGIDVRIAIDVTRALLARKCDVVVLCSQDQDFVELAREAREIAAEQRRWVKMVSAFPVGQGTRNRRGIDRTDWIPIDRGAYDSCLDRCQYGRVRRGDRELGSGLPRV